LPTLIERVEFREYDPKAHLVPKPWATTGKPANREANVITSLHIQPEKMEEINIHLQDKYRRIAERETLSEHFHTDDAEFLIVAYGLAARVAQGAVEMARARGIRAGLLRPITLFPYPSAAIAELAERVRGVLVVEMNAGQMVEDVRLAVEGRVPVSFYGRMGGIIPTPDEVVRALEKMVKEHAGQPVEVR
jgi:2-oxoglutarate ferredoxin oxidoreductase subunit alpha